MNNALTELLKIKQCPATFVLAVNDTLNVLNGKWKLPIIVSLHFGKKRFKTFERDIPKIPPSMLSKELRDLDANGVVSRKVYDTIHVMIEYELTESGKSLDKVLEVMIECWL
ncbi:winged helix-turn-helix transcriptional regulator [Bacteroides reticulotermitis]|uniref:Transcriptional regulator n=2 Tax=Bacteroides reticulotermitis TaxID=1133319 RepID=W4UUS0_9BACE|nr:winged helix-turn-helix transcriptional regulator [Bacteroides reticulotermitis]MBB4045799.1 DNA-binding HxlR family transcriptional regulator [Bacteroides reticulotermitis]GAE84945.1 transcriptional regulator [Bacteroides reticulotermitis JCM 10512]